MCGCLYLNEIKEGTLYKYKELTITLRSEIDRDITKIFLELDSRRIGQKFSLNMSEDRQIHRKLVVSTNVDGVKSKEIRKNTIVAGMAEC